MDENTNLNRILSGLEEVAEISKSRMRDMDERLITMSWRLAQPEAIVMGLHAYAWWLAYEGDHKDVGERFRSIRTPQPDLQSIPVFRGPDAMSSKKIEIYGRSWTGTNGCLVEFNY